MDEAEQLLRDVVFEEWRKSDCESYTDTLKLMSLIDVFLPYLPLERDPHMAQLVALGLQQRRHSLSHKHILLDWQPEVVGAVAAKVGACLEWCVGGMEGMLGCSDSETGCVCVSGTKSVCMFGNCHAPTDCTLCWLPRVCWNVHVHMLQVSYEGRYPLDGAKVVETAMMRHVDRLIRHAAAKPGCKAAHGCSIQLALQEQDSSSLRVLVANNTAASAQQRKRAQQQEVLRQQQLQQQQQQQRRDQHSAIVEL